MAELRSPVQPQPVRPVLVVRNRTLQVLPETMALVRDALCRWRDRCAALEKELAAVREERDRLRDACEHAKAFLERGMEDE